VAACERTRVARSWRAGSRHLGLVAIRFGYEGYRKEKVTTPVRVLLSAFSCEPEQGSEREVGFRALLAAANRHEVWVLTRAISVPVLRRFFAGHPLSARIHVEPVPFDFDEKGFGRTKFHWNYDSWQRAAARRAVELDRQFDFHVVHHVSFATIWTRAGVAAVPKPLVWGPVGGGVEPPLSLMTELGLRGTLDDLSRVTSRRLLARLPAMRLAPDTAVVVLAQNREIARRLRASAPIQVLPNATAVELDGIRAQGQRSRDLVFVGRLLAWKGGHLALRALRYVSNRDTVLRVYGEGPDLHRLERAARRWGLDGRVRFENWVPRDVLLPEIARAGALVHPSLHDDAPLSVAEALSLGTPVICLDHGGPAEVVRRWPTSPSRRITPASPTVTARRIAEAIDGFLSDPPPLLSAPVRPDVSFADSLLAAYEQAARSAARPKEPTC
jgi:glycosyltransferase involved in cell wall biosynthesis